ncbi:MAG: alkaline phosphatase D family protein [Pirellulales bacterium]
MSTCHRSSTWSVAIFPLVAIAASFLGAANDARLYAQQPTGDLSPLSPPSPAPQSNSLITRIAFGSCQTQDEPLPILETVVQWNPQLFVYLGDNIYGDTNDMKVLEAKYAKMNAKPEFQKLRANVPTIATWDDHDYGANDAGKEYPFRKESKEIFLKFWNEQPQTLRRQREGIYTDYWFKDEKLSKALHVIVLDSRTFRDPPMKNPLPSWKNDYLPDTDPTKSILGETQWKWLEEKLKEPADVRLICSSIQFSHEYNGFESWTNFPRELTKMVDLIKSTRASGVIFISGDVHWGELSALRAPGCYPLYDLTASGLNRDWESIEPNRNRIGNACPDFHFGMIEINWNAVPSPTITFRIHDMTGRGRVRKTVKLSDLQFAK